MGDHLSLVRHAAAVATAPPATAPPASLKKHAAADASARAAAAVLLAQLLDCLPRLHIAKPRLRDALRAHQYACICACGASLLTARSR